MLARRVLFLAGMQEPLGHSKIEIGSETPSPGGSLWREVTLGRFRIEGWHDRDGRRYLTLRENPASVGLTPRQRRILALRAQGMALKVIAVDVRASLTTVARELGRARTLLGFGSDADIAAVLGHAGR